MKRWLNTWTGLELPNWVWVLVWCLIFFDPVGAVLDAL